MYIFDNEIILKNLQRKKESDKIDRKINKIEAIKISFFHKIILLSMNNFNFIII